MNDLCKRTLVPKKLSCFFMPALFVGFFLTKNIMGALRLSIHLAAHDGDKRSPQQVSENIMVGSTTVAVFYNMYTPKKEEENRVSDIVKEQLANLQQKIQQMNHAYKLFVRSIGVPLDGAFENITTTSLRHDEKGDEKETLGLLWEYCQENPDDIVVYLHSKGSFHPSDENEAMRKFLTIGATSKECMSLPTNMCNVCGSRMSPLPHPHIPGNMWSAQCAYARKLLDPRLFDKAMSRVDYNSTNKKVAKAAPSCLGKRRYAAEHWVLSHPTVMPCDLSSDERYLFNYEDLPTTQEFKNDINLRPAPRFPLTHFVERRMDFVNHCKQTRDDLNNPRIRLAEYSQLYGEVPPENWFGWNYYNSSVERIFDIKDETV